MKTKKIILLIIILALVCVAGSSGLVGAFAENGDVDLPKTIYGFDETLMSTYGFGISSNGFDYKTVVTSTFSRFYPLAQQWFMTDDSAYADFSISLYAPTYNDSYYNVPYYIQMTDNAQIIYINFMLEGGYFDYWYGLPYISGYSWRYADGTLVPDSAGYSMLTSSLSTVLFMLPPSNGTFVYLDLEMEFRYYSDEEYDELYADYREAQTTISNKDTTIAEKEAIIDNLLQENAQLNTNYDNLYELYEEANQQADYYSNLYIEQADLNAQLSLENIDLTAENERLNNLVEGLQSSINENGITDGLGWITYAFEKVGQILSIELLPNITIGLLALIPLVLGVVFFVLRLIRGE